MLISVDLPINEFKLEKCNRGSKTEFQYIMHIMLYAVCSKT